MISNQQQHPQAPALMLWVMWFSLTSSVFIYFVVLQINGPKTDPPSTPDQFVKILAIVATCNAIASLAIRRISTAPAVKDGLNQQNFPRVLTSCIISWALAESVGIFGLILGLMGHPLSTAGLFLIASFATLVFLSPNFASLKGLVKVLPDDE